VTAGVILCGTHVGDHDPLGALCPRALLPVANAPLIAHTLAWLRDAGIKTAVICANHHTAQVRQYLGDGATHNVELFYYQDCTPRGPAGCGRDAADITLAENYVIVEGSVIPGVDLAALLDAHERMDAAATVVVHPEPRDHAATGVPASPGGIFVFARTALNQVPATGYEDLKEMLIPALCRAGRRVAPYPAPEALLQVVDLGSYVAAQGRILQAPRDEEWLSKGYRRRGSAYVHRAASVADSARLLGQIMVGPRTRVEAEAVLIGPAIIGGACTIGTRAVVGRSVVWDGGCVGRQARVDQCLVARNALIEAHGARYGCICLAADQQRPMGFTA
jgi:NDP-sugar pyrophosphorylase family protein